jgi:hypothetical protein
MSDTESNKGINFNYAFHNWEDLSERDQLISMISDLHKDIHGFRPRWNFDSLSDQDLQERFDGLQSLLSCEIWEEMETLRKLREASTRKEWTVGDVLRF